MSIELKPCPFCGSDSITNHDILIGYSVGCDKCGAASAYCDTEAESISAWNTRTAIQQAEAKTDEPVAWCIEANVDGEWVVQHPIRCTQLQVQKDASRYQPGTVLRIRQLVFADTHPAPGVPDGHVLVPIEPTEKMLRAYTGGALTEAGFRWCRHQWAAMLAASPAQKGGE